MRADFSGFSMVSAAKIEALKSRLERLGINLGEVVEQFTRGGGKGGQKINKTSNAVVLRFPRLNLVVRSQRERERGLNRFLALRELADRVEMQTSPETSQRLKERDRIRKQKDRRRRKRD